MRQGHAEFVAWCAGRSDSMGRPMSDWLLARLDEEGKVIRDANHFIVYETQAEWLARNGSLNSESGPSTQGSLFA